MINKDIKSLRKKLLLLQSELADELGVSVATIRLWEQGKRNLSIKSQRLVLAYCKERGIKCQENK